LLSFSFFITILLFTGRNSNPSGNTGFGELGLLYLLSSELFLFNSQKLCPLSLLLESIGITYEKVYFSSSKLIF